MNLEIPQKEAKCFTCRMELNNPKDIFCDKVCERMYKLYPGVFKPELKARPPRYTHFHGTDSLKDIDLVL